MEKIQEIYNRWTVLYKAADGWCICRCECGRLYKRVFSDIKRGKSNGCAPCYHKTLRPNVKHLLSDHPIYHTWIAMKRRCANKNNSDYKYYGGKGIRVCEEWLTDFKNFYDWSLASGWEEGLTIDRINSCGDYCPANCRWATAQEQAANKGRYKNNSSGYTGVQYYKWLKKEPWVATITKDHKCKRIGYAKTPKDAAIIRDKYIIENRLTDYKLQVLTW